MREQPTVLWTGVRWWELLLVILIGSYPGMHGVYWAMPLTGAAVALTFAAYRTVQFLARILLHMQERDLEDADTESDGWPEGGPVA